MGCADTVGRMDLSTAWTFHGRWQGQVVATAIHTGHDLRPEVAQAMVLPEDDRFREEDPFTDELSARIADRVVVHRSRFEVDLNRGPADAVYATPEQSWGMKVWHADALDPAIAEVSLGQRQEFYQELAARLDEIAARGPFVLFDVHSYNHRRHGPEAEPEPQADNPDINLGTGSMDRKKWAPVVDTFLSTMAEGMVDGRPLDVRENVKFQGAEMCRWVHERYPDTGCALAIEFKKIYMDEWTGQPHPEVIGQLADSLGRTAEALVPVLRGGLG